MVMLCGSSFHNNSGGVIFPVTLMVYCNRYRKAQFALGKGDEDLAREALKRRKSYAVSCHHSLKSCWELT